MTFPPFSDDAHRVLKGLKDRRALCTTFIKLDSKLYVVADAEAVTAEAVAKAKLTKETKKDAEIKRSIAKNLDSLVRMHLEEVAGLTEILNRCELVEGYVQACGHEPTTSGTGDSSSSTT